MVLFNLHQLLEMSCCNKQNVVISLHHYFDMDIFLTDHCNFLASFYCFLRHVFDIPVKVYPEQYYRTLCGTD